MNLFGMWEFGAPKVGAPSSHVTSPGPLFIGDALDSFWLRFLGELDIKDMEIIKKNLKNFIKKKERIWVAKVATRVVTFSASVAGVP